MTLMEPTKWKVRRCRAHRAGGGVPPKNVGHVAKV